MTPVRVVVVDAHEIDRAGLGTLLSGHSDLEVVAMASSGDEGLQLVEELEPDLVLLDHDLEDPSGVEVCARLKDLHPKLPVVMLSVSSRSDVMYGSMLAGAAVFLRKDVDGHLLRSTIRDIGHGNARVDLRLMAKAMRWAATKGKGPGSTFLSAREIEALRLVADGCSTEDISREMKITQNTARTYLRRAMGKLECSSRAEAAAEASRRGLI